MKRLLDTVLSSMGVAAWYRRKNRAHLPILMYHGVVRQALEPFCWHQLPLREFERQMNWVAKRYRVLPLEEALTKLFAGTLPPRSLAITFDDGYRNNFELAAPVLTGLDLPATIFLITDLVGTDEVPWPDRLYLAVRAAKGRTLDADALDLGPLVLRDEQAQTAALSGCLSRLKVLPDAERRDTLSHLLDSLDLPTAPPPAEFALMDWDEVEKLRVGGRITFGAHTPRHRLLSRLPDDEVEASVQDAQAAVTSRLGTAPKVFAYPNGRRIDFDERAERAVQAAGIPFALSTEERIATRRSPPTALPRICIGSDLGFDRFKLLVSGAWDALRAP